MGSTTTDEARRGRPRGRQFDTTMNLRLPRETVRALHLLAKAAGTSAAKAARMAILRELADSARTLITQMQEPGAPLHRKLRAVKLFQHCKLGMLGLSPEGSRIARAKARVRST
jgi:hypothetical protein